MKAEGRGNKKSTNIPIHPIQFSLNVPLSILIQSVHLSLLVLINRTQLLKLLLPVRVTKLLYPPLPLPLILLLLRWLLSIHPPLLRLKHHGSLLHAEPGATSKRAPIHRRTLVRRLRLLERSRTLTRSRHGRQSLLLLPEPREVLRAERATTSLLLSELLRREDGWCLPRELPCPSPTSSSSTHPLLLLHPLHLLLLLRQEHLLFPIALLLLQPHPAQPLLLLGELSESGLVTSLLLTPETIQLWCSLGEAIPLQTRVGGSLFLELGEGVGACGALWAAGEETHGGRGVSCKTVRW